MNDSYQAVYDAVRSTLSNCDIGSAVEQSMRESNLSHYVEMSYRAVNDACTIAAYEATKPSVLFKPSISVDGNQWCALYGDNLQDGVAGFGDSVELAMADFDKNWRTAIAATKGDTK